jgi:hypothetical protein
MNQIINRYILWIPFCFAALLNHKGSAQIITDRPNQTESSSTVEKSTLQIEAGFQIGFEGDHSNAIEQLLTPTTLFRQGISERFELRILSQIEQIRFQEKITKGISDLEIGTKIQLYRKAQSRTQIAWLSHLRLPTGSDGLTDRSFGTINKLSISHEINEFMAVGYNIGYNYFGLDRGDLTYSAALGFSLNSHVSIYVEPYGMLSNFKEPVVNFDAGFTYLVHDNLQFDFSFGTGISDRMNYVSIGCSWKIINDRNQ